MGEASIRLTVDRDEADEEIESIRDELDELDRIRNAAAQDQSEELEEVDEEIERRDGQVDSLRQRENVNLGRAAAASSGIITAVSIAARFGNDIDSFLNIMRASTTKALSELRFTVLGKEVNLEGLGIAIDDAFKEAQDQVIDRVTKTLPAITGAKEFAKQALFAEAALGRPSNPGTSAEKFIKTFQIQDAQRRSAARLERQLLGDSIDTIFEGAIQTIHGG